VINTLLEHYIAPPFFHRWSGYPLVRIVMASYRKHTDNLIEKPEILMARLPLISKFRRSFIQKAVVVLAGIAFSSTSWAVPAPKTAPLVYVIDGDTIAVRVNRQIEKVRLIGIDTPESRKNNRAKLQAERSSRDVKAIVELGHQASMTMKEIAKPGTEIRLEFDVRERDKYGRLLAYAYLPNGTMINEEMLSRGYAQLLTMPPNVRHVARFKAALKESQQEGRGLWASGGFNN
jgi:micrococcal nuclease